MAAERTDVADENTRGEYVEDLEEDKESNIDADEAQEVAGLHENHVTVINRDSLVDYSVSMKDNERCDDDDGDDDEEAEEEKDLHRVMTKSSRRLSHEVKMLLRHASRCVMKNPSPSSSSPSSSSPPSSSSYISTPISSPSSPSTTVMMHPRPYRPADIVNRTRTNDLHSPLNSCSITVVNDNDDDLDHRAISIMMDQPTIGSDGADDQYEYIYDIMGLRQSDILLQKLRSLQAIIPSDSMHTFGAIDSHPCVIRDALGYLKVLRQEIKGLKGNKTKSMIKSKLMEYSDLNDLDAEVKVEIDQEERLNIRVSCHKRSGSVVDLMSMLESMGLIFDHVNVSSHAELLLLNASINITI